MSFITPVGDIAISGWSVAGAGSIHAALADASDATYATTDVSGATALVEDLGVSIPAGQHQVQFRASVNFGTPTVRVSLLNAALQSQGASVDQTVTTTPTTFTLAVTTTGAARYLQIALTGPADGIVDESGDYLVTETGDYLVWQ